MCIRDRQSDRDFVSPSAQANDSVAMHHEVDRILDERRCGSASQQRGQGGNLSGEHLSGEEDEEDTGAGGDEGEDEVPALHNEDDDEEDRHMSVERPRGRRVLEMTTTTTTSCRAA